MRNKVDCNSSISNIGNRFNISAWSLNDQNILRSSISKYYHVGNSTITTDKFLNHHVCAEYINHHLKLWSWSQKKYSIRTIFSTSGCKCNELLRSLQMFRFQIDIMAFDNYHTDSTINDYIVARILLHIMHITSQSSRILGVCIQNVLLVVPVFQINSRLVLVIQWMEVEQASSHCQMKWRSRSKALIRKQGCCAIWNIRSKLISNSNLAKSRSSITSVSRIQSFWNFA